MKRTSPAVWIRLLKAGLDAVSAGSPDTRKGLLQRGALLGKLPASYRTFVGTHGRFIAGPMHVLSPAEMTRTTKFVRLTTGATSGDEGLTTDHLVAFAAAGDESAWCFCTNVKGELPVYYFHQDNPPAKLVRNGKWWNKAHAKPQFKSFAEWLEAATLDVLCADGEMVGFDEPTFRGTGATWLSRLRRLRDKASSRNVAKPPVATKPTRARVLTRDFDRGPVSTRHHTVYEIGQELLLHYSERRRNSSAPASLREQRQSFDSIAEAKSFADAFVKAKQADRFRLLYVLDGKGAKEWLTETAREIRGGSIRLLK